MQLRCNALLAEVPSVLTYPKDLCGFRLNTVCASDKSLINFSWILRKYKHDLLREPSIDRSNIRNVMQSFSVFLERTNDSFKKCLFKPLLRFFSFVNHSNNILLHKLFISVARIE